MGSTSETPLADSLQWLGKPRPVRVIVVGAGISGIAAVKLFNEMLGDQPVSLTVYEKNNDVGGTWFENRYPGCSCDIPAHGYTYSWEGNPSWSRPYVGAKEIFDFYKGRAQAYGVFERLKLSHRVVQAVWNEAQGKWKLEIEDVTNNRIFADEAEVLINAGGFLNSWKWPDIPGIDSYKGTLVHSAKWDDSVSFDNKTVAVIGSGSSAIQIVPRLQKVTTHLFSFVRSPIWITPEFGGEFAPEGRNTMFTAEQKATWQSDSAKFLQLRKALEFGSQQTFSLQRKDSEAQKQLFARCKRDMSAILNKKEGLAEIMIPKFAVGCRRMTPGHGYLEALVEDNVTVVGGGIRRFTSEGLETNDGRSFKVDTIVCATGFDTTYRPSFKVIGQDGKDLRDVWAKEPRSYISVAASGFPNYFMATGPNFPLANGTVVPCMETTLKYAFKAVRLISTEGVKSISPKERAVEDFQVYKDTLMKEFVWTSSCRSWYKNGLADGKVWGPWPGSATHFMEFLERPRWEDYDINYLTGNRFDFLGKGVSSREANGGDLAWFVQ
ncbi:hypothetical protein BKA64DRAFT_624001 [Cadophora sp. MPI-SDFR-AT-0126]|nr:hypothetical protein BKA64DRAFT_624001 [Leotiomycetes sp. MPI-SDFR-AT-0126]